MQTIKPYVLSVGLHIVGGTALYGVHAANGNRTTFEPIEISFIEATSVVLPSTPEVQENVARVFGNAHPIKQPKVTTQFQAQVGSEESAANTQSHSPLNAFDSGLGAIPVSTIAQHPVEPLVLSSGKETVSAGNEGMLGAYERSLMQLFSRRARDSYPEEALSQEQEGRVTLKVSINAQGQLVSVRMGESSGIPSLDRAALALVSNTTHFPLPPSVWGASREFELPIRYNLIR